MSCSGNSECLCGCCSGTSVQTPLSETNLPGLPAISYRVGTWSAFKESMLARLSSSDYPALAGLKTRNDDDFAIAFLDATAIMLDVLTFYQERLANESYLRTATQLRSVTELARLISYVRAPGVSASVYLAFTLKTTPGQPSDPSAAAITIPQGTQVQSVPDQGQKPQTFETSADIQAKPDWNALPVLASVPWQPGTGATSIYFEGTGTQLQPGDSILILGVQRERWTVQSNPPPPEQWDMSVLNEVQVDKVRNVTYVAWDQILGHESGNASSGWTFARVFAFRQKAALFGHNAPDPNLFVDNNTSPPAPTFSNLVNTKNGFGNWFWNKFQIASASEIYLDATYQKVMVGSWFALVSGSASPLAQLYKVQQATTASLSQFTLTGKVTLLAADYSDPNIGNIFPLQSTTVWAQSEELVIADQPLDFPLYGGVIDLQHLRPDLIATQVVAVSGKRQKLAVSDGVIGLNFTPNSVGAYTPVPLKPGDVLILTDPNSLPLNLDGSAADWSMATSGNTTLDVEDANGRVGTVTLPNADPLLSFFDLAPSSPTDPMVKEIAYVTLVIEDVTANGATSGNVPPSTYPHTQLRLTDKLANCYDRSTTTVNANVGLATHGQSVSEILGSGSASTPNQSFPLKQSPVTYIQNSTAQNVNGRQSTLQLQVNSVKWKEVPTLYDQSSSAQVFATANQADGTADAIFGDGVEGALLPTGQNNLRANYRIGSGKAGNVGAGKLTTLMDRPLGVSGVTNPEDASGGQDPDGPDQIQANAPQTVLTLGRAVSITDYQDIASTYAGIAKAYAIWISMGPALGVYVTVAGPGGTDVDDYTRASLRSSLQKHGNPLVPITVATFTKTTFTFSAAILYDSGYDQTAVQAQVLQAVQTAFSFDSRSFGQSVSTDEIAAIIQNVPGVTAANVTDLAPLQSSTASNSSSLPGQRLCASLPIADPQSLPSPAEILLLDPNFAANSFTIMT